MSGRTIAIGDVHGCAIALRSLLQSISPTPDDTIVQLGDMIDRGPDSKDVIDQLIELRNSCHLIVVLGNHEELMLNAMGDPMQLPRWIGNGGDTTLKSYGATPMDDIPKVVPAEHLEFLRSCVEFHETENAIFIHAGYVPELPVNEQPALALRWRVTNKINAQPHCSNKLVVVGHTPQKSGDILDLGFLKCIDTNCYRGGWLTALDVDTSVVWQTNQQGSVREF